MREKLTFANVMSSVAVFLALGGTALAVKANSVGSRQIIDDSIKGRDVADGRLKGKDLKSGAIGAREVDEAAFDLEYFVKSGSDESFCDPSSTTFVNCGSITLGTQEPSRVAAGCRRRARADRRQLEGPASSGSTTALTCWPSAPLELRSDPDDGRQLLRQRTAWR